MTLDKILYGDDILFAQSRAHVIEFFAPSGLINNNTFVIFAAFDGARK